MKGRREREHQVVDHHTVVVPDHECRDAHSSPTASTPAEATDKGSSRSLPGSSATAFVSFSDWIRRSPGTERLVQRWGPYDAFAGGRHHIPEFRCLIAIRPVVEEEEKEASIPALDPGYEPGWTAVSHGPHSMQRKAGKGQPSGQTVHLMHTEGLPWPSSSEG